MNNDKHFRVFLQELDNYLIQSEVDEEGRLAMLIGFIQWRAEHRYLDGQLKDLLP